MPVDREGEGVQGAEGAEFFAQPGPEEGVRRRVLRQVRIQHRAAGGGGLDAGALPGLVLHLLHPQDGRLGDREDLTAGLPGEQAQGDLVPRQATADRGAQLLRDSGLVPPARGLTDVSHRLLARHVITLPWSRSAPVPSPPLRQAQRALAGRRRLRPLTRSDRGMVRCSASTSWTACPLPRPGTQQCSDLALLMGDAVKSASSGTAGAAAPSARPSRASAPSPIRAGCRLASWSSVSFIQVVSTDRAGAGCGRPTRTCAGRG